MKTFWCVLSCVVCCMFCPTNLQGTVPSASWFPQASPLAPPTGQVIRVKTVKELIAATSKVEAGGTILVADGHYLMPQYIDVTKNGVTLRSESGNRDAVIIDGVTSRHGELIGVTGAVDVTIADITVQNIKWNGIKINSDRGAERVTIRNCVIHNIWQRGIKAPAMPKGQEEGGPRDCRIEFCLFYNDRPKQFSDDETDTPKTYNGNYIGGIDVKNTINWTISDNVFIGIQGRTREGRGCIYISENGRGCKIERNIFIDSDIAIALGNPSLGRTPLHAINCTAQNNFISECPETGILACYTRGSRIVENTIHDPKSKRRRLIWVQQSNAGLAVERNHLVAFPILNTGKDTVSLASNVVTKTLAGDGKSGQSFLPNNDVQAAIALPGKIKADKEQLAAARLKPGQLSSQVVQAMRKVHAGFKGQHGYVAQFGDSITYTMAFWTPIGWDDPSRYLDQDDDLPKSPTRRWRDYVKGARDKGPKHANYSGWRVGQVLNAMRSVIDNAKPEVAIIMVGTNDIAGGRVPAGYRDGLEQVIQNCLDAHCVPILNTIPPRRNRDDAVEQANRIVRDVASKMNVPLADFHAECLRRRPGQSWDGTVISRDGVHPSGGKCNDYSESNLNQCGYALRNWLNFLVYRQLYFRVLEHKD